MLYYISDNNKLLNYSNYMYRDDCKITDITDMDTIDKHPNYVIVVDGVLQLNPNYEKEEQQKEAYRISHLKCTKRVLALMLQQLGISYSQLKALIATNEQAQLEWDLCVELERCNPLLDIMGQQLGITPGQLDDMFKYANGEIDTLN